MYDTDGISGLFFMLRLCLILLHPLTLFHSESTYVQGGFEEEHLEPACLADGIGASCCAYGSPGEGTS